MGKKLLLKVLSGDKNIKSPYHPNGVIKYKYILGNPEDKIGNLLIWCDQTFIGINISRVKIPDNVDYIKGIDIADSDVPKVINFVKINPSIWY